jgi:hypothetical protein
MIHPPFWDLLMKNVKKTLKVKKKRRKPRKARSVVAAFSRKLTRFYAILCKNAQIAQFNAILQ